MGWPKGWTSMDPISYGTMDEWLIGFKQSSIEVSYDDANKRKAEKVQEVQSSDVSQAIQHGGTGKQRGLLSEEVLQSGLCKQQGRCETADVALEGKEADSRRMSSVWYKRTSPSTSLRREQGKLGGVQFADALHLLPQVSPRYGIQAWFDGSWEVGVPRVADKIANRVDRLRAIGNGQVSVVAARAWIELNLLNRE